MRPLHAAAALVTFACGLVASASPARAGDSTSVNWRPFAGAAFQEASDRKLPVFLLLTAPWNRDHFLLSERLFRDPVVVRSLRESAVPVRCDATLFPELRRLYRISSGLLPSFHFLDARARVRFSLPPIEPDEMTLFLEEAREAGDLPAPEEGPSRGGRPSHVEGLADSVAVELLARLGPGAPSRVVPHADADPAPLVYLVEYAAVRPGANGRLEEVYGAMKALLHSPLHDREDGGLHRAVADTARGIVHHEKLLRPNAELVRALSLWFRLTDRVRSRDLAARTLLLLNERFRTGGKTQYAGSLSADIYAAGALVLTGRDYYALSAESRIHYPAPRASGEVPVGANFVVHQALLEFLRAVPRGDVARGMETGGTLLLEGGFEADGAARRALNREGTGNLRDQADAGSGLLACHAGTGRAAYLEAAVRVGEALRERFWVERWRAFRNVARDSNLPEMVKESPPDPAWNGAALRFLAELSRVTGRKRWHTLLEESLTAWAGRVPQDEAALAELGRAALRAEREAPLVLVVADPESDEGERLLRESLRIDDPLLAVRWIRPDRLSDAAPFRVRDPQSPALYLVWDGVRGPFGGIEELDPAYREARDRVRR